VDEFGLATTKNDGLVPEGMEDKADLAIANCPEFAISILED
jgi:ferredoxin